MDEDASEFVKTTLTSACETAGFHFEGVDRAGFSNFSRDDGTTFCIYAASLGSILMVTGTSLPGDAVRTLHLSPDEAHSVEFVYTHLVSWLAGGGKYETQSRPHLQGLASELTQRVSKYLDDRSSNNLRRSSKALTKMVPVRAESTTLPTTRRIHVWRFEHLA